MIYYNLLNEYVIFDFPHVSSKLCFTKISGKRLATLKNSSYALAACDYNLISSRYRKQTCIISADLWTGSQAGFGDKTACQIWAVKKPAMQI